jgi:hypothetical protein
MKNPLLLLVVLATTTASLLPRVVAHTRLECPPPRSGETGAKLGPCDASDDPDNQEAYPLIPNALNTVTWLESIPHPGAPARFALSFDGVDDGFESCILLDHVPHDEYSRPDFRDPTTYHRASITLFIPDVYCERCYLQLMTVMSDEIHGVPRDSTCAYHGAVDAGTLVTTNEDLCPVVYHSCAPVSINGTIPRKDIATCNTAELEQQLNWPFMDQQEYSLYKNKGDPGIYNQTDKRLLAGGAPIENCSNFAFCEPDEFFQEIVTVPSNARYSTLAGSCAAMVGVPVSDFVLGQLPSNTVDIVMAVDWMDNRPSDCNSVVCQEVADCFTTWCKEEEDAMESTSNNSSHAGGNKTVWPDLCMAPRVTTCEHCFPESPCSSAMKSPGIVMAKNGTNGGATKSDAFHTGVMNGLLMMNIGALVFHFMR